MGKKKKKKSPSQPQTLAYPEALDLFAKEFSPPLETSIVNSVLLSFYDSVNSTVEVPISKMRKTLESLAIAADEAFICGNRESDAEDGGTGTSTPSHLSAGGKTTTASSVSSISDMREEDQQRLDFLTSVFPSFERDYLRMKLDEQVGIIDLEVLLEELLNELFIADLIEPKRDRYEYRLGVITYEAVSKPKTGVERQGKKREKLLEKQEKTLVLGNPRGLSGHSTPNHSRASSSNSVSAAWVTSAAAQKLSTLSPHHLDSLTSYLSTLLNFSQPQLLSLFEAGHPLSSILSSISLDLPKPPLSTVNTFTTLISQGGRERAELLLRCSGEDIDTAFQLNEKIEELGGLDTIVCPPVGTEMARKPSGTKPKFSEVVGGQSLRDEKESKARVDNLKEQFSEAARNALDAFQRKDKQEHTKWTQELRKVDSTKRAWMARGDLPRARKHRTDGQNVVDLHTFTLAEALATVQEALHELKTYQWPLPLRIITGAGNNSPHMVSVLKPKVIAVLQNEGWKWEYDHLSLSHADGIGRAGGLVVTGFP